ncbi:MAG: FAD-dependent oxidoreductase [Actinomycetaceae bacterium]|nr:FAD-dependent oxidoreductase [Actinomycetaceae bacterium]
MTDAIVIGGGVAGLTSAFVLAHSGKTVTVIEERGTVGGLVAGAQIGGVNVDIGAESFARRAQEISELCTKLGWPVCEPEGSSWVWNGTATPIAHGILGIPASWDDPAAKVLDAAELERARQDLDMDASIGAAAPNLAELVQARMGAGVLEKMVTPVAGGIHAAHPKDLDIDTVAPGLRKALAEEGSLQAAVAKLRGTSPRPVVVQPAGGMFRLPTSLAEEVTDLGGTISTRHVATGISRVPGGEKGREDAWSVRVMQTKAGPTPADPPVPTGEMKVLTAPILVVATGGQVAQKLLRMVPDLRDAATWNLPTGNPIAHVSLCVQNEALDNAPRGSGMLVAAGTGVEAKALTHYSAKWPWCGQALVEANGPGAHLLRVSYGRAGEIPSPTVEGALVDASKLLGVELTPDQVLEARVTHWGASLLPHTLEHRQRTQELRRAVAGIPGLAVVGAWVAGTGLAAVVPDALKEAKRFG